MSEGNTNPRPRWSPVKNVSTEEVPAFGVMASANVINGTTGALEVTKPFATEQTVWVNDGLSISADGNGNGTQDTEVQVAYDEADGTPLPGESWGVKGGSWLIHKHLTGFRITAPGVNGIVNATRTVTRSQTCCSVSGLNPTTVPLGCPVGPPPSGSPPPPPPPPGACLFGKDPCLDADNDTIWTAVEISPGVFAYGPCVEGSVGLSGSDRVLAMNACAGRATIAMVQTWIPCSYGGQYWGLCNLLEENPLLEFGPFTPAQCLTIFNGTRSYIDAGPPTIVNTTFNGQGFPFGATIGRVQFSGSLVMCPNAPTPWFYFQGTIKSTAPDPSNPGKYDCGCAAVVGGCNTDAGGVTQTVYTSGSDHILRIATGCGTVDIKIATCPPPPPPPPPPPNGVNCISGVCTVVVGPGTFPDIPTCVASGCSPPPPPPPPTYDCISFVCTLNAFGTGTFPDLATCVASCTSPPPPPPPNCCPTLFNGTVIAVSWSGGASGATSVTWQIPGTGSVTAGMSTLFVAGGDTYRLVCLGTGALSHEVWRWNAGHPSPGTEPPDSTQTGTVICPLPNQTTGGAWSFSFGGTVFQATW